MLKLRVWTTEYQKKSPCVLLLGGFDGLHAGHKKLVEKAKSFGLPIGIMSIVGGKEGEALFTLSEREKSFQNAGAQFCFSMPFEKIKDMQAEEFLFALLQEFQVQAFVCGDDFRFGHKGEGNAAKLADYCRELGLPYAVVPEQTLDGIRISSTHIRSLIEAGDVETAAKFLGHPHVLSGEVVHGRHLGRTIGVPTANVLLPEGVVVPKLGVYACTCVIDGKTYVSVTNIGSRPTVGGHQVRSESWILDLDGDLYGKRITLKFHKFLRPEQKFDSLEELRAQIQHDAAKAYGLLK